MMETEVRYPQRFWWVPLLNIACDFLYRKEEDPAPVDESPKAKQRQGLTSV